MILLFQCKSQHLTVINHFKLISNGIQLKLFIAFNPDSHYIYFANYDNSFKYCITNDCNYFNIDYCQLNKMPFSKWGVPN